MIVTATTTGSIAITDGTTTITATGITVSTVGSTIHSAPVIPLPIISTTRPYTGSTLMLWKKIFMQDGTETTTTDTPFVPSDMCECGIPQSSSEIWVLRSVLIQLRDKITFVKG